jgi:hypothetical protein
MDIGILYVVFNKWIRNPKTNEIPYKIGITRGSVDDRYYGLGLKMPGKFETLFAYKFDDCSKAEQTIHSILNKKRENGEWFNIKQEELDHIKATCELMEGKLVTDEVGNEIKTETGEDTKMEIEPKSDENIGIESFSANKTSEINGITGKNILQMKKGDSISNFFEIIVNSKKPNSENWAGDEYKINGTPMKGINWIGNDSKVLAVIIRTTGKYSEDSNGKQYAFEAKKGCVDKTIKTNQVIINQKKENYPILYFIKNGLNYIMLGKYSVDKIYESYVTLIPFENEE